MLAVYKMKELCAESCDFCSSVSTPQYLDGCSAASLKLATPSATLRLSSNWSSADISCILSSFFGEEAEGVALPKKIVLPWKDEPIQLRSKLVIVQQLVFDGSGCTLLLGKNLLHVVRPGDFVLSNTSLTGGSKTALVVANHIKIADCTFRANNALRSSGALSY